MNLRLKFPVFIFIGCLFLLSCEQDKDFPDTPSITLKEFRKLSDTDAIWTMKFTDGDGDVGTRTDADADNFFTTIFAKPIGKDSIVELEGQPYRIPAIKGIRTSAGVEGEIELRIQGLDGFKIENKYDSIYYKGYLVDRSGKQSNVITTPKIDV